ISWSLRQWQAWRLALRSLRLRPWFSAIRTRTSVCAGRGWRRWPKGIRTASLLGNTHACAKSIDSTTRLSDCDNAWSRRTKRIEHGELLHAIRRAGRVVRPEELGAAPARWPVRLPTQNQIQMSIPSQTRLMTARLSPWLDGAGEVQSEPPRDAGPAR